MIRILSTVYNSKKYVKWSIESLKAQTIKDFKCYLTNDLSTDGTEKEIKELIKNDDRFVLINNNRKYWQTGNYYQIHQREEVQEDDIMVALDSDDWLHDPGVLERVYNYYSDNKTWITYGQFMYYRGPNKFEMGFARPPQQGIKNQRQIQAFTTTHLRTWKAWLFKKIKKEDFIDPETGWFIPMAGDLVFMFPMLEMAGENHSKFVKDINYIYNEETDLNEFKINIKESMRCANITRNKLPYEELDR